MTSYYIDPERCFEVPFRIPLPDKGTMAARLAGIHLIMRDARERQSQFCAEHRRKLSSQPCRYRHKAKAMMDMGQLKSFVGNLARHYIDYLGFHQESPKNLSPLAIEIPSLCPSLSPPLSYLFGPPKQDDFNSIIKSNLSWSQFAAPAPAGWREQFLHERRWEHQVEHRIMNEYSVSEREAEYAALESQRRQLWACLRMEVESPPPLGRKLLIPLPLATPPLKSPLANEGIPRIKSKAVADSELLTTDSTRSPLFVPDGRICEAAVQQRLSIEPTRQSSPVSSHPLLQRPSLRIVIPGSSHQDLWLGESLFGSPLSRSGTDAPSPSVLLNADDVRSYLDLIHGRHPLPPEPGAPLLSVTDNRAEQMLPKLAYHEAQIILTSPSYLISTKQSSGSKFGAKALFPSTWSGMHVHQPQPIYPTKRRASLGILAAVHGSSKRPRLVPRL